jgi:hypothetical protein
MALEGGVGSASHVGHYLAPGKIQCPLYRRLGEPQGWSGQVRKIMASPGFDPWTAQPVASRPTELPSPHILHHTTDLVVHYNGSLTVTVSLHILIKMSLACSFLGWWVAMVNTVVFSARQAVKYEKL